MGMRTKCCRRLALVASLTLMASAALAQVSKKTGPAQGKTAPAKSEQPKFKAIFEPVNYKQDLKLTDVHFVSETTGWVTGENGTLLKTTDGGDTWNVVLGGDPSSKDEAIGTLRFVDATHGWAVKGSQLLRTADGENWEQAGQLGGTYAFFNDYAVPSSMTVVQIIREHNELARSEDGGKSWKMIQKTCEVDAEVQGLSRKLNCVLKSLFFLSPTIGYAIGATSGKNMVVFRTEDGGMSWTPQLFPDLGHEDETYFWQGIVFLDENRGFAILPRGEKFLGTSDRGKTWHGVIASVRGPLKFAGREVGWSFHGNMMTYTVDGGTRWANATLALPAEVQGFSLPSPLRGYVVGDHGMIYRYRIVPVDYTAKGMIAAPMMPPQSKD